MHQPLVPERRSENPTPQVYDGYLRAFGDLEGRAVWGGKYKFSVNDVPPPGYYDPERGDSLTRSRSPAVKIHEERMVPLDAIPVYSRIKPYRERGMRRGEFEQRSPGKHASEGSEGTPKP